MQRESPRGENELPRFKDAFSVRIGVGQIPHFVEFKAGDPALPRSEIKLPECDQTADRLGQFRFRIGEVEKHGLRPAPFP